MQDNGCPLIGTNDYGFTITPIGQNARDIGHFVKFFGYTPAEALRCATGVGADLMGHKGELGIVKHGALADLLIVDGNPLEDQDVLVGPARFSMIMKDGVMHRDPRNRKPAFYRDGAGHKHSSRPVQKQWLSVDQNLEPDLPAGQI